MSAAGASDLVLALACGWLAATRMRHRPGLALAALLIGVAAALGVAVYLGAAALAGPHRFASLVAACTGLPLLAWALRWPDDPIVAGFAGAARAALLATGIGVAATVLGLVAWAPVVAVAAALLITATMVVRFDGTGIAGAAALLIGLGAVAVGKMAPFDGVVVLHLGMAAALLLLARAGVKSGPDSIASERRRG